MIEDYATLQTHPVGFDAGDGYRIGGKDAVAVDLTCDGGPLDARPHQWAGGGYPWPIDVGDASVVAGLALVPFVRVTVGGRTCGWLHPASRRIVAYQ